MAKINDMDEVAWQEWLSTRPEIVQSVAARFPPDRLYLLKSSGRRVYPYSYSEDGTLTVVVSGYYNLVTFERQVFGIKPEDLEECDLPKPDELLGAALSERDGIDAFIQLKKTRPQFFLT